MTVPTDPGIIKLFEVRLKLTESASAEEDAMNSRTIEITSDLVTYPRTTHLHKVTERQQGFWSTMRTELLLKNATLTASL